MAQFKSWDSYGQFSREIASHRRYVRTPDSEEFLRTVASTCEARLRKVPQGKIFWRAQLGHDSRVVQEADYQYPEDVAFDPLRIAPPRFHTTKIRNGHSPSHSIIPRRSQEGQFGTVKPSSRGALRPT